MILIKKELYTSRLVYPNNQDPSIEIRGLERNVSLGLLSLYSNVSSAFLRVCLIGVSQFLVIEIIISSVSFLVWSYWGSFIYCIISWQIKHIVLLLKSTGFWSSSSKQ